MYHAVYSMPQEACKELCSMKTFLSMYTVQFGVYACAWAYDGSPNADCLSDKYKNYRIFASIMVVVWPRDMHFNYCRSG